MNTENGFTNRRILVIDDNERIHDDFKKILTDSAAHPELAELEAALFGEEADAQPAKDFEVDSAFQGQEGFERIRTAIDEGRPYAMAFVDMRMPPGWDGAETISRIWEVDPELQVVLCTAYSDYSWNDFLRKFGQNDRLHILKKPFDNVEAYQLACTLTEKWTLSRRATMRMEQLEQEVGRRTAELVGQNEKLERTLNELHQAQAQLLQADKLASIGQLAAGVAHEINNPIGYMSSNLNTLKEYFGDIKQLVGVYDKLIAEPDPASPDAAARRTESAELRERIQFDRLVTDLDDVINESIEGANRVRKIVADLRDFSHVDNPDVTIEDINRLLDKTINVAWNELKYKAELVREYGELPQVRCYGGKLAQLFLNLLVNAAHAIASRGTITLRTGHSGDRVWIEVEDTGCGIPEQNLKRVFEPFFTNKEVGKGTGLGLYLAYNIVEAHRGHIDLRSTVGKGTTFRIELPVAGPPDAEEQAHDRAA